MCRLLEVARSGFYAWLHKPLSERAIEDRRLLELIRASYAASGGVYGAPRVFLDLREVGERCGRNRVARLMRSHKIKALRGYKAPRPIVGRPSLIAPNTLDRQFTVPTPDTVALRVLAPAVVPSLQAVAASPLASVGTTSDPSAPPP